MLVERNGVESVVDKGFISNNGRLSRFCTYVSNQEPTIILTLS